MAHNNPTSQAVAASVSQALKDHSLTLKAVEDATGIAYATLWRRTNNIGKRVFDIDELAAIAALLDTSITALITYADADEPVSA